MPPSPLSESQLVHLKIETDGLNFLVSIPGQYHKRPIIATLPKPNSPAPQKTCKMILFPREDCGGEMNNGSLLRVTESTDSRKHDNKPERGTTHSHE